MTPNDRWAKPDRIRELSRERFKPWPLYAAPVVRKVYDPWYSRPVTDAQTLGRGFVRDERFAGGSEQVIKPKARKPHA